ncbi:hypothetical protein [Bradyrhizobium icense]|uniref:Uncharacterized protein n=1 Tax=Bradyrhizobium icense TaxID=1274631 RepID=A0A1B1U9F3_9BRAD|nr:hypothetical protein [Bradyrhizobium icense]ANV99325.1 hypothetical protein LMTR13_03185 [Bradyrhizobium icense]
MRTKIAAIIDELRSQKIGLVLAHQKLRGQIEDTNVISSLENCAIKMVNVGMGEVDYFSKLLDIPVDRMKNLPRGHFATDIRWEGTSIMSVPKAKLPFRMMTADEERALQLRMKKLYGVETRKADQKEEVPSPRLLPDKTDKAPEEGLRRVSLYTLPVNTDRPVISQPEEPETDPSKPSKWKR